MDRDAIGQVVSQAFGRKAEAELVEALREGGYARVSLVALENERIVGHIMFSALPIVSGGNTSDALALAPVAVLPKYHDRGIGTALVREGLEICRQQGHRIVIVLGSPAFYRRSGFSSNLASQLESPYSGETFMALELVPGAMNGVRGRVQYPSPFEKLASIESNARGARGL